MKGNTKIKIDNSRSRNWCFTLNNYTETDITQLHTVFDILKSEYIFQEEKGENGTPHLQGFFKLKNAKSFSAVKKSIGIIKIHLEKCKNVKASIKYCQKEDTKNGKLYTNMNLEEEKMDSFQLFWAVKMEMEKLPCPKWAYNN